MTSSPPVPPPPELHTAAVVCFGDRLELAARYAGLLVTEGVTRGLIGPRESDRIWDRHLLNCAVIASLVPAEASVIDVGSGAGLPGVVLAIARPDLSITLLEPLARRAAFLTEVVAELGLSRTAVVRARAEECVPRRGRPLVPLAQVVTARAVASLDRLAAWCLPLVANGGCLLALKGSSAGEEADAHHGAISRAGGESPTVRLCGEGLLDSPTTVVEIARRPR